MPGATLRELQALWLERDRADPYVGTLVNAWLERGGRARAVNAGDAYVDVGTLHGYREAIRLLGADQGAVQVARRHTAGAEVEPGGRT
jgi:hypothetical protein